ncbi:MAG: hypothetical protein DWQ10_10805 [Calditrichaeota bacterium]|nr:MAG: hypothetical protein DWQ10_10805 [Calditrichota bacterium]
MKILITILTTILAVVTPFNPFYASCGLKIDHTPIIVYNLEDAEEAFKKLGFVIKPGYKHKNGILNSHVKFTNGTEIELISVNNPRDDIARSYTKFLKNGEGGTYLALSTDSLSNTRLLLEKAEIDFEILSKGFFTYIIFPRTPGLQHIFIIHYKNTFQTPKEYFEHAVKTKGITDVSITGNENTMKFFKAFGCFAINEYKADKGIAYELTDGRVTLVPADKSPIFRVKGVNLNPEKNTAEPIKIYGFELILN